jgi:hypothetical protein
MIVSHLETAHDVWIKLCNTNEALLKLSHLIRTPIIDSIKPLL